MDFYIERNKLRSKEGRRKKGSDPDCFIGSDSIFLEDHIRTRFFLEVRNRSQYIYLYCCSLYQEKMRNKCISVEGKCSEKIKLQRPAKYLYFSHLPRPIHKLSVIYNMNYLKCIFFLSFNFG